jgi:general secretion pathway protein C
MLGFENGDRLQRINSYDITSPDLALEAYAHLRTANLLLVEVNRRGADTYLLYRIA